MILTITTFISKLHIIQEFKSQDIKFAMVLYSLDIRFANDLLIFLAKYKWLYGSVVERWSCNRKITGSYPAGGYQSMNAYHLQCCLQLAASTCDKEVLVGLNSSRFWQ